MIKLELVEEDERPYSTIEDIFRWSFIYYGLRNKFFYSKGAHYLARLYNKYPNASPNPIKALLISSAEILEKK